LIYELGSIFKFAPNIELLTSSQITSVTFTRCGSSDFCRCRRTISLRKIYLPISYAARQWPVQPGNRPLFSFPPLWSRALPIRPTSPADCQCIGRLISSGFIPVQLLRTHWYLQAGKNKMLEFGELFASHYRATQSFYSW